MKTFKDWLKNKNITEVSKPVAATAGWFLGGPVGAMIGHHLGQDKKIATTPSTPERKSVGGWSSQGMVDLSPEELLERGVIEGQIVMDIYAKDGRSIQTILPNGVKTTKFIGRTNQVLRNMANLSIDELMKQGVIQGKLIKDEVRDISPGVKERWITTKSSSGIDTIKYIGNL